MIDVILDAGHGGRDPGAVGLTGLTEKECTLYIAKKCEEILKAYNINVKQTREDDSYLSLSDRASTANQVKTKYFISIHVNSADISSANGTEVFALGKGGEGEQLASSVLNNILRNTDLANRGIKFANFAVLRETEMPAILVEICFISNSSEEELLKSDSFKDKIALSIAKGYLQYVGKPYEETIDKKLFTEIISTPRALKNQAKQFAKNKGAAKFFIDLVDLYWNLSGLHGGIDPTIAYAQAIIETSYGKFESKIDCNYKNPCGLKVTTAIDNNPESYMKFESWEDGIVAHIDHLALYVGASGYPRENTKDPRHFAYLFGKIKYAEELSGNWTSDINYGSKIIEIVKEIQNTTIIDNFDSINVNNPNLSISINLLEEMRKGIGVINTDLDSLKTKCKNLEKTISTLEGELSNKKVKNSELSTENKDLSDKVSKYQEIIEDILNLVNDKLT